MKFSSKLMIVGLCLVNGVTTGLADVIVDGQVIQSTDISDITIDPVSGDISITAGGLYTVTKDDDPQTGPSVVINTLSASSNNINVGDSITITWDTTDADSCTPSNGFGGWSSETIGLPGGTSASLTSSSAGTYSFRLDCSNDTPTSTFRTVSVVVESDDPPPPPSNCPDPTLAGNTIDWSAHFGQSWPSPTYSELITGIRKAGYLAIEFNTGSALEDGGVATITHTSTAGERLGAISECPGDFSQRLPDTVSRCTEQWFIGGSIKWNTFPGDKFGECDLEPNTTYYLNLTFTDGVNEDTDRCEGTENCRTIVRVWK